MPGLFMPLFGSEDIDCCNLLHHSGRALDVLHLFPTPAEQFGGYYPRTRAPLLTLQLFVKAANAFSVAHALKAEGTCQGD